MSETSHHRQVFFASFLTLIAAGTGFAVRTGVLAEWAREFGFTNTELGTITGGGLVGFGVVILIGSVIAERFNYKAVFVLAFLLHVLSAVVTLAATPIYNAAGKDATYWCLYIGLFLFAIANGLCEAVINPLVATLYPKQKTHYLNILHAGWPGGLILGGLLAACFLGDQAFVTQLRWEIPMALFLIPTVWYGLIILKEKIPRSEAGEAGISFAEMLKEFAAPLMLALLFLHACVGYVELGTDSWISRITESFLTGQGLLLFVYASAIMFVSAVFCWPDRGEDQPTRPALHQRAAGSHRPVHTRIGSRSGVDLVCRDDLRSRQDVSLANHAGCCRRAVPTRRCPNHGCGRRNRDALGRLARRTRHRIHPRRLRVKRPT